MWNLYSFFSSIDKLAIHCDTEEKAQLLCQAFHSYGKTWVGNESYIDKFEYPNGDETCYTNARTYGNRELSTYGWTIIPFEDMCLTVITPELIQEHEDCLKRGITLEFSEDPATRAFPRILLQYYDDKFRVAVYKTLNSSCSAHIFEYNIKTLTELLYAIATKGYKCISSLYYGYKYSPTS